MSLDAWLPYCDIVFTLQTEDTFLYKKYILYNRYCHLVNICYVTLHCTKGRSRQTGQHFSCDFSVPWLGIIYLLGPVWVCKVVFIHSYILTALSKSDLSSTKVNCKVTYIDLWKQKNICIIKYSRLGPQSALECYL